MVSNRGSLFGLLAWQWKKVLAFTAAATAVVLLHEHFEFRHWALPALPVAVAGGALGIFVSFRTNSAYARWWEGRILWGGMVNVSRHFTSQVLSYVPATPELEEVRRRLVLRHVGYVHVLRCLLRNQDPGKDPEVNIFVGGDDRTFLGLSNPAHLLINAQLQELAALRRKDVIDAHQLQSLDGSLRSVMDFQGGAERIKRTPMPRGYAFIAEQLTIAFAILLPFALVKELGWVTIPITLVVCLAFALISEVGRVLEDPFTLFYNALPLYSITKTIEKNLREALGERDLPALPTPNEKGILM